jgi:hypothetical protein
LQYTVSRNSHRDTDQQNSDFYSRLHVKYSRQYPYQYQFHVCIRKSRYADRIPFQGRFSAAPAIFNTQLSGKIHLHWGWQHAPLKGRFVALLYLNGSQL